MATHPGNSLVPAIYLARSGVSSDLSGAVFDITHRSLRLSQFDTTGANVEENPVDISGALVADGPAVRVQSHGDFIFERIHYTPGSRQVAFLLSDAEVPVEVWNAFRDVDQTVTSIDITGPAGVSVTPPSELPVLFPRFSAKIFLVKVEAAGTTAADNTVVFNFAGIPEPVFQISGLRLLPFTITPDWDAGIDDEVSFATDVMVAYDDTEQRMMLRAVPNRSVSFTASALDSRESGLFASLLWSWQARSYGVPLWMDASVLTADGAQGSNTVTVDTANLTLAVNDTVLIFADAFNWFASAVQEIAADHLTLETRLDRNFFKGKALVIPVIMGRVASAVPFDRPTNGTTVAKIKFDLQVVAP
jgi:hypothetical protein